MSMGRQEFEGEELLWIPSFELPRSPGHAFYDRLNELLARHAFDEFCEKKCKKFYAQNGRPSIPPGTYFRMLLIGYFEGIGSERGICWRCSDSLSLRSFLGLKIEARVPDHSSLSRIRQRLALETHQEIFTWILKVITQHGLLKAKTIGIDATTLEANAALKSIVRRDTEESYQSFLESLAKSSGIENPSREDLAKLDRKRKNKGSNDDWKNPHDPDAKIAKMKDGRTHLAHKFESGVDLDTGAIMGVSLQGANLGDTTTVEETFAQLARQSYHLLRDSRTEKFIYEHSLSELVSDKGYHKGDLLLTFESMGVRTYMAEPNRGKRNWKNKKAEQKAVYANRRRIRGARGKRLQRKRGELLERPFAHLFETGGMRRTHLRGHENILKRLLIHVGGFNLGLVMRKYFGIGKPRGLQNPFLLIISLYKWLWRLWLKKVSTPTKQNSKSNSFDTKNFRLCILLSPRGKAGFSTGC